MKSEGLAPERRVADMAGPAALPRWNGELVFGAAWEGRVFGLALALNEQRRYDWAEFRERLMAEIAQADQHGDPSTYYERWLAAFERLLLEKGFITPKELAARLAQFTSGERDVVL